LDGTRFDSFTRSLTDTPSRRTVTRAFIGLALGSGLAPVLRREGVAGKDRKRGRRKRQRHKDRAKVSCAAGTTRCVAGQAGDLSGCCSTAVDPIELDPVEICTACGCCDLGFSQCCPARDWAVCCRNGERCCYAGTDFDSPYCCPPNTTCCGGVCCPATQVCCKDGSCVAFQSVCDFRGG
jgi:hypothetical protein